MSDTKQGIDQLPELILESVNGTDQYFFKERISGRKYTPASIGRPVIFELEFKHLTHTRRKLRSTDEQAEGLELDPLLSKKDFVLKYSDKELSAMQPFTRLARDLYPVDVLSGIAKVKFDSGNSFTFSLFESEETFEELELHVRKSDGLSRLYVSGFEGWQDPLTLKSYKPGFGIYVELSPAVFEELIQYIEDGRYALLLSVVFLGAKGFYWQRDPLETGADFKFLSLLPHVVEKLNLPEHFSVGSGKDSLEFSIQAVRDNLRESQPEVSENNNIIAAEMIERGLESIKNEINETFKRPLKPETPTKLVLTGIVGLLGGILLMYLING